MNRRAFVTGLGAVLTASHTVEAQPAAAVPKIGFLSPWASSSDAFGLDAFRDALREHGYTDGTNVVIIPEKERLHDVRCNSRPQMPDLYVS